MNKKVTDLSNTKISSKRVKIPSHKNFLTVTQELCYENTSEKMKILNIKHLSKTAQSISHKNILSKVIVSHMSNNDLCKQVSEVCNSQFLILMVKCLTYENFRTISGYENFRITISGYQAKKKPLVSKGQVGSVSYVR